MKKVFTTLALGLAAISMTWAECPYEITWATGSSYASRIPVGADMKVTSLQTVWGAFPDGTTIVVGDDKQVHITGPDVDKSTALGQASEYNPETQATNPLPAIKINFQYYPSSYKTFGEYTATIPAGSFTINGTDNEEFDVTFNIEDTRVWTPTDLDCYASPSPGTYEELKDFNVIINNLDDNENTMYVSRGVKQGVKATIAKAGGETKEFEIASRAISTGKLCYGLVLNGYTLTEDGTYTVTIPEGAFLLESNSNTNLFSNKQLQYEYTISSGTTMRPNVTPAPGTIQALAGIELEAPDGYEMSLGSDAVFNVTKPDGSVEQYQASISENRVYIYLRGENINFAAGEYTVEIPKKSINFIGGDDVAMPTAGFELKYNVTGGTEGELAYTLSDGDDNVITESTISTYKLQSFYLKFDKDVTPTQIIRTKVIYPDGSTNYATTSWSSGNKRFMIFMNYPTAKGTYEITFPAGAACADGVFNEEIKLTVNYMDKNQEEFVCTSTPENGSTVTELQNLAINLDPDTYTTATLYLGGITKSYFSNDDDQENATMRYLDATENPLVMTATLIEPVTEIGDYSWVIPENSIQATKKDGSQVLNAPIRFVWSVRDSGSVAESFGDETTDFTVYDLNGVCVLKNGSREQLNSLGKGIFIINGKTFILR